MRRAGRQGRSSVAGNIYGDNKPQGGAGAAGCVLQRRPEWARLAGWGGQDVATVGPMVEYYYRHRYYHAQLGRFINRDPIGFEAGINLYEYAGDVPTILTDPSGLDSRGNLQFLWDFLTGGGDDRRCYCENDVELQEMKDSPGAEKLRREFYHNLCRDTSDVTYGTGEAFVNTIAGGTFFSDTSDQVAGFGGASAKVNPDGTVTFTISNKAGRYSFLLHRCADRPPGSTGSMRTIYQTFQWTEKIDPQRCIITPRSRFDPFEWSRRGSWPISHGP